MRLVMTGIVDYLMNNSAIRKRKKGIYKKKKKKKEEISPGSGGTCL